MADTDKYPLVICYIAIENGPFIVDLPIKTCDFPIAMLVYQRVRSKTAHKSWS